MRLASEKSILPVHTMVNRILDDVVTFAFGGQLLAYWCSVECILQGLREAGVLPFNELALCLDAL